MLRLSTQVTTSPTVWRRSSSATSATAATSGPRAENRVTISSSPTSGPAADAVEHLAHRAVGTRGTRPRDERRRRPSAPEYHAVERRPTRTTSAPVPTSDASSNRCGSKAPGSSRPSPSASDRSSTGKRRPGRASARDRARTPGTTVSRGARAKPAGLGDVAQPIERRPGPLRVHVVGGDGGHAAPVVDAGVEQHAEVVGQVGRRLHVDVGRQDEPGQGDGLEVLVRRARRRAVHGRARLRQEVLDDHLLHVPVTAVGLGDRLERVDPVGARSRRCRRGSRW